ncbi:hypothetical protein CK203_054797 [Vitis vinifera]|uniref:Uncharacterized protein n=1 Tax=Vitis vinifera TaxID=29760 RepID=A0A438GIQ6_VITVI|nr:hypothetical protein CK203_054797 [Vitis vinifera]
MEVIAKYLRTESLPNESKQAHKIRVQVARFTLIEEHLYKRFFTGPYLRCLNHSEAQYILAELHEGAEATNKTLVTALKKRLEQAKGKWVEELPGVLWAYRTTPGRPTGNSPFALAYGMDVVIPTEIGFPTIRIDARG